MEKYDVSVIIPVYNCEKYVKDCVKSISNQDYSDLSKIQVILVDDGSTDKSLKICQKMQKEIKDFTIEIIAESNEGVSSARNKGIKAAKGKYIMFIDADDFISKNAIKKLVKFFDEHYDDIDIVTYPLYYYDQVNKEKKKLNRYDKFINGTDVYDLIEYYDIIQPNMNIVVKNEYENNILFDEKLMFHEDEKYNIDNIMKKIKIGYVDEVKYIYRRYENATTETKSNPYYCFENMIELYEYYIKTYKDSNGKVYKNVQTAILNDFRWRISQDKLLPYSYNKEKFDEAIRRIKGILNNIDNEIISSDKYMDRYHKMYLYKLKGIDFEVYTDNCGKYSINSGNTLLDYMTGIEIVVNRFKVKRQKIYILAYLKSPLLYLFKPDLYIQYKNKENKNTIEKLELQESTANLYRTNMKVGNFYMFEYEIDMKSVKDFRFIIKINEEKIPVTYFFNKFSPIDSTLNSFKVYDGEYRVQYKKGQFLITKPKQETVNKDKERAIKRYNDIDPQINKYRKLSKPDKKIWIYNDRIGVFDNAYIQFKYDLNKNDGIERYYALDGDIKNAKSKFTRKELKYVVKFGSKKHKELFLNSDKIITSFSNMQEYCPFANDFKYYKDILKYDLIYLQHGVLHATCLRIYSKEFTPLDKIVISSVFEENSFIKKYKYNENDLIKSGMPRLDDEQDTEEPKNKIIYAPSWRNYLVGKMINRERSIDVKKFKESKYYIETIKFLQNEKLLEKLKEKNITIDFKLHPIFEPYKECFSEVENENINVSIGNTNLNEYKAFITDFSSFQFDFVNLKKPITYFVPDMDEFKSGLHLYRELDLKHEDAFGKLCLTGDELLKEIIKLIDNNFEMDELYKERMENFFFKVDNRKEKLYQAIKNY